MTALAPNLFDRRFQDFVEIGRARLRPLAPEWTDHNAHDPGITLMELLAWVAEAQLYSVGHMRRDERAAYASLLGLARGGTRGSTGMIWSDRPDLGGPAATFSKSVVIPEDAVIHVVGDDAPTFRPEQRQLWTPGRVTRLESVGASGRRVDLTLLNDRGGAAFLPFGEQAGAQDVLALRFACRDDDGLFGRDRKSAAGAGWTLGVLAAASVQDGEGDGSCHSPLAATLVTEDQRVPLRIVSDTSRGMLVTGTLVLDLSPVAGSPREFEIELSAPHGLPRPPRVLRIEPNVIPIRQGRTISRELHVSTGQPDWSLELSVPGLRFEPGKEPVEVEVAEVTGLRKWSRVDRLTDSGPDDRVYELDAGAGRLTFGNRINGMVPSAVTQVLATYAVSDGEAGNLGRNRKWSVAGFGGTFGVNVDPITGGAAPPGWIDQRRAARARAREEHALVSADDIAGAAKALRTLEVNRAWVFTPPAATPRTGAVTLIVMRARPSTEEPERPPETRRWLEAVRRRLTSRMPLGTRLAVRAPRYAGFSIRATIEAQPGRNPLTIETEVRKALARRLALVDRPAGGPPREPGVPVTQRDVTSWIRRVDGVARVRSLELRRANGTLADAVAVGKDGLPRWSAATSTLTVVRPEPGASR